MDLLAAVQRAVATDVALRGLRRRERDGRARCRSSTHDRQMVVRMTVVTAVYCVAALAGLLCSAAAEQHLMEPRVPADKLAEARVLTSPLPPSAEIQARGKALYEGKATCMNCHGQSGA